MHNHASLDLDISAVAKFSTMMVSDENFKNMFQ